MSDPQDKETEKDKPRFFEEIKSAIINKQGLSFVYERKDGNIFTHNAVYPRRLFRKGDQFYFKAYCYFTDDIRTFRVDRIKSLHVKPEHSPLAKKQQVLNIILFAILIFFVLLLLR